MPSKKVVVKEAEPETPVAAEPKETKPCETCKGVGVNMAVDATKLCADCDGSGRVEV